MLVLKNTCGAYNAAETRIVMQRNQLESFLAVHVTMDHEIQDLKEDLRGKREGEQRARDNCEAIRCKLKLAQNLSFDDPNN